MNTKSNRAKALRVAALAAVVVFPYEVFGDSPCATETVAPRHRVVQKCTVKRTGGYVTRPAAGIYGVPYVVTATKVYPMVAGYQTVFIDGVRYYTYGDGVYYLPLGETAQVVHILPP